MDAATEIVPIVLHITDIVMAVGIMGTVINMAVNATEMAEEQAEPIGIKNLPFRSLGLLSSHILLT